MTQELRNKIKANLDNGNYKQVSLKNIFLDSKAHYAQQHASMKKEFLYAVLAIVLILSMFIFVVLSTSADPTNLMSVRFIGPSMGAILCVIGAPYFLIKFVEEQALLSIKRLANRQIDIICAVGMATIKEFDTEQDLYIGRYEWTLAREYFFENSRPSQSVSWHINFLNS